MNDLWTFIQGEPWRHFLRPCVACAPSQPPRLPLLLLLIANFHSVFLGPIWHLFDLPVTWVGQPLTFSYSPTDRGRPCPPTGLLSSFQYHATQPAAYCCMPSIVFPSWHHNTACPDWRDKHLLTVHSSLGFELALFYRGKYFHRPKPDDGSKVFWHVSQAFIPYSNGVNKTPQSKIHPS